AAKAKCSASVGENTKVGNVAVLQMCGLPRRTQQIIGREGETATFLSRRLFTLNLRGGGFAPRQLNRYVSASRENEEASRRASIEGDSASVDNREAGYMIA
ncbi:MAG: hypothetical protein ABR566_18110, partial [Pyrinomonadaceae bacterium]